ncbi:MAG: hypothetical protein HQL72_14855 [Magnetococcales bacterium]|nr:hypothetical protein [Magnetococcales bacterium]
MDEFTLSCTSQYKKIIFIVIVNISLNVAEYFLFEIRELYLLLGGSITVICLYSIYLYFEKDAFELTICKDGVFLKKIFMEERFYEWEEVESISIIFGTCRLNSKQKTTILHLNRSISNLSKFKELVLKYAGEDHSLSKAILCGEKDKISNSDIDMYLQDPKYK